ncbi:hypothetical protein [Symbiopectobacterium sp. RP]|uniref:hypothetical protein n=1 Tax=Symbiopectobacterium sp. RP TaxID=3248553 RepID=UPI003D2D990C
MMSLIKNIFYLGVVKFSRLIIPLLIIPVLSNVFSKEYLSYYFTANLVAAWVAIIIDYAFDYSMVRKITGKAGKNKFTHNALVGVLHVKVIVLIFLTITSLAYSLYDNIGLYVFWGVLLGAAQSFSPVWLYMAVNKVLKVSVVTLLVNLVFLPLCLLVSNDQGLWGLLLGLVLLRLSGAIYLTLPYLSLYNVVLSSAKLKSYFIWGWSMFRFQALASLYTSFPGFYYTLVGSHSGITAFGIADRVTKAGGAALSPIIQAVYPFICRMINTKDDELKSRRKFLACFQIGSAALYVIFIYLFSEIITSYLIADWMYAEKILKIYSWSIFFVSISNVYGVQGILALGYIKPFNKVILAVTITHFPLLIILSKYYDGLGVAYSIVISEFISAFLMFLLYRVLIKND